MGGGGSRNGLEDPGFLVMLPLQHKVSKVILGEEEREEEVTVVLVYIPFVKLSHMALAQGKSWEVRGLNTGINMG